MFREGFWSGLASLGLQPNFQGFETGEAHQLVSIWEISLPLGRDGLLGIDHSRAALALVSHRRPMKSAAQWRKFYWILGREAQGKAGTSDELEAGALRGVGNTGDPMSAGQHVGVWFCTP